MREAIVDGKLLARRNVAQREQPKPQVTVDIPFLDFNVRATAVVCEAARITLVARINHDVVVQHQHEEMALARLPHGLEALRALFIVDDFADKFDDEVFSAQFFAGVEPPALLALLSVTDHDVAPLPSLEALVLAPALCGQGA